MGLEWCDVPPLRQLVEMLAVLILSDDMNLLPGDAIRIAAESLGLEDDDELVTHPADRFARTLCNWQRAAAGRFFQPQKSDAA